MTKNNKQINIKVVALKNNNIVKEVCIHAGSIILP